MKFDLHSVFNLNLRIQESSFESQAETGSNLKVLRLVSSKYKILIEGCLLESLQKMSSAVICFAKSLWTSFKH